MKKRTQRSFIICTLHEIYSNEKSGRMRWAGHVAHVKNVKCKIEIGKLARRTHLGKINIDGKDDIKVDLRKIVGKV